MKKLDNTFKNCYYLKENGTIFDSDTNMVIEPDKRHFFLLLAADGTKKKVALKTLYRELYNKEFCKDDIENLEGEEWKEVEDSKGRYFVSNKGRIKSLHRYSAILLKPYTNQSNYLRVDISNEGCRSSVLVHRLVAAAFLPLPDRIDMQIHHKDFNFWNNAADNLEWLSAADHRRKHNEKGGK